MKPERLIKKSLRGMTAYKAEALTGLRMDTNANLLGANPVVTRFIGQFDPLDLNDYPTPHSDLLVRKLSQFHDLDPSQFIIGNGADEILDLVIKCFIDPGDHLVMPDPTFGMYEVFGRANCADIIKVPLKNHWSLDIEGLLKPKKATLLMLANPNNPTGNAFCDEKLERILNGFRGIVVLDEAYAEYARFSHIDWTRKYSNLIVLKTFSKAYGLAGLRVGYAVAPKKLIAQMYKVKAPYNVNAISEGIAAAALMEKKFLVSTVRRIEHEREKMTRRLTELGFRVHPSVTNFLLAKSPIRSRTLWNRLAKRGIIIRDLGGHPRLRDHVRITLGSPAQNGKLLRMLGRVLPK